MKRRNKLIAAIIAINMVTAMGASSVAAKAEVNYTSAENLVNTAISESNFYYYNMAYAEILKLSDVAEKEVLLAKLSTIGSKVWTKDISEIVQMFEVMAKEKSGRTYDQLQTRIKDSNIKEIDKEYLYSELYSWGINTVWTAEYKKAVAAVIKVWNDKTEASALEAEKAIADMTIVENMEYLTELLTEAKVAAGLVVSLDGKYFDVAANGTYIGTGKSVILDLSKDTKERTVTLKGTIKDLTINAPLATVILENAEVNQISLLDVSGNSLHLRGTTKVQSLIVNDKNDNARVVLQGKATVANAEVKSAAKIEVNVDSEVKNPFGKLQLNTELKKIIELLGDFRASVVQVQNPAELKVAAKLEKLEVAKEAKDTQVTVAKEGKIQEIKAEADVKLGGEGTIEKVTPAPGVVVDNNTTPTTPPVSGGSSGDSMTKPAAPTVTADDAKNIIVGINDKMEYKIGDVVNWTTYSPENPPVLKGNLTVKVRVKAVSGVSYASDETVITFKENLYSVTVNYNGKPIPVIGDKADMTVSEAYERLRITFDIITDMFGDQVYANAKTKVESLLNKLRDAQLDGDKGSLLEYIAKAIETKNSLSSLPGYLRSNDVDSIVNYMETKNFDSLYNILVNELGGDVVIPQLSGDTQFAVKINEYTYEGGTANNRLTLEDVQSKLGVTKDTMLSELMTKSFDIEVSYGTERTYSAKAAEGTLTLDIQGKTYTVTITTK